MSLDLIEAGNSALETAVLGEGWEYVDADTQHLTHNVHRYSGKFIPQIAARAVSMLTRPGELVVDPYCGSGTTLLEAAQLQRRAVGIDLNPLAVLIAKVKTSPVLKKELEGLFLSISKELSVNHNNNDLPLFSRASDEQSDPIFCDPRLDQDWYRKWFQPHVLEELVAIDRAISRIRKENLRDVARVAFSDILRRSSNAAAGYPNVMFDKRVLQKGAPIRPFLKALERIIEMVGSLLPIETALRGVRVIHGNAMNVPLDDSSVDAVISHPPYIGSIPYAEYGALSLQWLGVEPKQLDKELTGGRRQSPDVVKRFEQGYQKMLVEAARILKPGRHAFLMVGNPVVRGQIVDLAEMTVRLSEDAGLGLVARTERRGVNRRANKMGAEHLLFFRKK
jgi:SAM-dependent methyltransferase